MPAGAAPVSRRVHDGGCRRSAKEIRTAWLPVSRNGAATSLELALQASPVRPVAVTPADLTWRKLGLRLQPVGPEIENRPRPSKSITCSSLKQVNPSMRSWTGRTATRPSPGL